MSRNISLNADRPFPAEKRCVKPPAQLRGANKPRDHIALFSLVKPACLVSSNSKLMHKDHCRKPSNGPPQTGSASATKGRQHQSHHSSEHKSHHSKSSRENRRVGGTQRLGQAGGRTTRTTRITKTPVDGRRPLGPARYLSIESLDKSSNLPTHQPRPHQEANPIRNESSLARRSITITEENTALIPERGDSPPPHIRRPQHVVDFQSSGGAVVIIVCFLLMYLIVGTIAYMELERWTVTEAL